MTTSVTSRKTHLVGAWPGISGAHAMDAAMHRLGAHLLRITDGETGERGGWITPTLAWLRANPDIELVRDGDGSDYESGAIHRVRPGRTLDPNNIELNYYRTFQRSYPGFTVIRERQSLPGVSFQVGIPAPIDLAVTGFGYEAAQSDSSISQAFADATVREVDAIHSEAQDDVVFQVESVFSMAAVVMAPEEAQSAAAVRAASSIISMVERAPVGARFGVHLCLGDYHHRALVEMGSARPLVLMANTLAHAWPSAQALEYIHAPFAAAEKPGSFDPEWYEPLSKLDLPEGVRFVAGFIHEDLSVEQLRGVHAMIERAVGREVDIAATCGLGRRPSPDQAWDAMDKTVALLTAAAQQSQ
jgi:hypothetical protein